MSRVSEAYQVLTVVLLMLATSSSQTSPAPAAQFDAAAEAQLVQLINQTRSQQGLAPLTVDERLTRAARKHTQLMVQHLALSHQFDGEPPPQTRFSNEGLPSDSSSENVALNQNIPGAHDALMHSPPHRAAILDPNYNVVGVGVLQTDEGFFVTEDFARKLPEMSEQEAEAAVQKSIQRYALSSGFPAPGDGLSRSCGILPVRWRSTMLWTAALRWGCQRCTGFWLGPLPILPSCRKELGRCSNRRSPGIRWELVLLPA